jgi:5-methylcytosine-specific restriction endonuclease McrA
VARRGDRSGETTRRARPLIGRICPGCGDIVSGACPRGCRPGGKKLTPRRRRNQKVWSSTGHRNQRLRILKRDDFTCSCGHEDRTGRSLVADHIHGIDERRGYDDDELQTLCLWCSGAKAARGDG